MLSFPGPPTNYSPPDLNESLLAVAAAAAATQTQPRERLSKSSDEVPGSTDANHVSPTHQQPWVKRQIDRLRPSKCEKHSAHSPSPHADATGKRISDIQQRSPTTPIVDHQCGGYPTGGIGPGGPRCPPSVLETASGLESPNSCCRNNNNLAVAATPVSSNARFVLLPLLFNDLFSCIASLLVRS